MPSTVLVVEDDGSVAESIREALDDGTEFDVPQAVRSGDAAIEAAKRLKPALVLMDIELHGPLDGIETAQRLYAELGLRVLYISGIGDDATLTRAKETSPLGYLKKPFNPKELRLAVDLALRQVSLERELKARQRRFQTTLQAIGDAVLTTNHEEHVTFMNRAAEALLEVRADDAIGKPVAAVVRLVDEAGAALPAPHRNAMARKMTVPFPQDARLASTTSPNAIEIEGTIAPLAQDGIISGVVMILRDVSDRRNLERRLSMTERLTAVGTMAAGMQHEINNPLASIMANVGFAIDALRDRTSSQGPALDLDEVILALQDATAGAERVRRTVDALRVFTRGAGITTPPPSDVEDISELSATPPSSTVRQAPNGTQAKRRGRVLVVDDEVAIGMALKRLLDDHDVAHESDAKAALTRLAHDGFDVVFCDLVMPNMNGMEFFEALSRSSPALAKRVVFLTGGATSKVAMEFLQRIENPCVPKPFSRDDVTKAVRRLLE